MSDTPVKRLLAATGVLLVSCLALSMCVANTARQTQDAVNLGKSLELGRELNQSLQLSLGITDRLVWVNALYGVALVVVTLVLTSAVVRVARAVADHRAGGQPGQRGLSQHSLPHYLVLGQRGVDYLLRLPEWQREQVLVELAEMMGQVQQSLGRGSRVKLLDQQTGKETRWS